VFCSLIIYPRYGKKNARPSGQATIWNYQNIVAIQFFCWPLDQPREYTTVLLVEMECVHSRVKAYAEKLPKLPLTENVTTVELDELFSDIRNIKRI